MFSASEDYWRGQRLNAPEAIDLLAGFAVTDCFTVSKKANDHSSIVIALCSILC